MSGRLIKKGHVCQPPSGAEHRAIWRCDCGQNWRLHASGCSCERHRHKEPTDEWQSISRIQAWLDA
jgi:hypothetical protein